MTALEGPKMMRALGAIADAVVRQHDTVLDAPRVPDLPPGLTGRARRAVFDYLGLANLPETIGADVALHNQHRSGSRALPALALLADAIDGAWRGDDDATRAALVYLGAAVVRWIQAIDDRAEAGS